MERLGLWWVQGQFERLLELCLALNAERRQASRPVAPLLPEWPLRFPFSPTAPVVSA